MMDPIRGRGASKPTGNDAAQNVDRVEKPFALPTTGAVTPVPRGGGGGGSGGGSGGGGGADDAFQEARTFILNILQKTSDRQTIRDFYLRQTAATQMGKITDPALLDRAVAALGEDEHVNRMFDVIYAEVIATKK